MNRQVLKIVLVVVHLLRGTLAVIFWLPTKVLWIGGLFQNRLEIWQANYKRAAMIDEKWPPSLCLKWNDYDAHTRCGICGQQICRSRGLCLFLEGTCDSVCDECGERHARILHDAQIVWARWVWDH